MSTILSKIYERERPLIYFFLWDESDRRGCETFTGQNIRHNLFIAQPKEHTGSVWYSEKELAELEKEAESLINKDPQLVERMVGHARAEWVRLEVYAKKEKRIENGEEYLDVYRTITSFWYTMNTVYFRLPERPTISAHFKELIYRLRDETQEYSGPLADYMRTSFEELFPSFAKYSMCVSPDDIQAISSGSGEQLRPALEDRYEHGCFLLDGVLYPYAALQDELQKRDLQLEVFDTVMLTEVKGSIGYKGIARGIVRVIRTHADLEQVQAGEILVARLTEPAFMVGMQKVAAFVTDEGGIMSHAAIVAREMKKPCIIGTKFATQVFKDGDTVEVDAEKGIVRKL